jgi:hypothetical protein
MTIGAQGPNMRDNNTWYLREDLVYLKGDHTFSFGADIKAQDYGWLYCKDPVEWYHGKVEFSVFDRIMKEAENEAIEV